MHKKTLFCFLIAFVVVIGGYYVFKYSSFSPEKNTSDSKDVYTHFVMEGYDLISKNYWMTPDDYKKFGLYELPEIFHLSLQKVTGISETLSTSTREGVEIMMTQALATATTTEAKKQMALITLNTAVQNLLPIQRSELFTKKQEVALRDTVSNINPDNNLYGDLGLEKGASATDVDKAYTQKEIELKASTTPAAQAELQKVTYARSVLTNTTSKTLYDAAQIEPTVGNHVDGKTLYIDMRKISPTTLIEFVQAVDNASTTRGLSTMIIDLRGNIGGSLAFLQSFLGLFIGNNQYAFDLFSQGNYQVQRTVQNVFPELSRFTEIALLADNMTQSTAELTTATFKKFHIAHVVGATTRGWGTVENTYPITTVIDPSETYSLLVVNSITLREDNQPIEGRGVDPDVNIKDPNWKNNLSKFFTSSSLISAIEKEMGK